MKKLLIISNSVLNTDPRIINQYLAFKDYTSIDTLGIGSINRTIQSHEISKIFRTLTFHYEWPIIIRKPISFFLFVLKTITSLPKKINYSNKNHYKYWRYINKSALRQIKTKKYDLIWANDIEVLPIAVFLKSENTKLVFDAHEYFPMEQSGEKWLKKNKEFREYLFESNVQYIDSMVTVSDSISELFFSNFGIRPTVIMNAKPYTEKEIDDSHKDNIHIVHHGVALPNRNLEGLIYLFQLLDSRFILHFYLKESIFDTLNQLKKLAQNNKRILFHEPVKTSDIPLEISKYDIGIYILKNVGVNEENALPNKLFECIQARLMLIYPDLHEITTIVEKYNIGFTTDAKDLSSLAARINKFSYSEIIKFKTNTHRAASDLCAEKEWEKMRIIASNLLT